MPRPPFVVVSSVESEYPLAGLRAPGTPRDRGRGEEEGISFLRPITRFLSSAPPDGERRRPLSASDEPYTSVVLPRGIRRLDSARSMSGSTSCSRKDMLPRKILLLPQAVETWLACVPSRPPPSKALQLTWYSALQLALVVFSIETWTLRATIDGGPGGWAPGPLGGGMERGIPK